jgi:hypothetical protein
MEPIDKKNYHRSTICCWGCKCYRSTPNLQSFCRYYGDFIDHDYICDIYTPSRKLSEQRIELQKECDHVLKEVSLFDEGGRIDCVICEKCNQVFSDFQ